jgi:hypothetical protein
MALIFPGKTTCALCGQVIHSTKAVLAYPAFLPPGHRLYPFTDAAFQTHCLASWPESQELEHLYRRYREIWDSRPTNLSSLQEIEEWGKKAFKEFE